jgi:hypothetical protein
MYFDPEVRALLSQRVTGKQPALNQQPMPLSREAYLEFGKQLGGPPRTDETDGHPRDGLQSPQ